MEENTRARAWSDQELTAIGRAEELRIGTVRDSALVFVPIWVVRVGSRLFIRSFRGAGAKWYARAIDQGHAVIEAGGITQDVSLTGVGDTLQTEIDRSYRDKYGRYGDSYITPMTASAAVATTLELTRGS